MVWMQRRTRCAAFSQRQTAILGGARAGSVQHGFKQVFCAESRNPVFGSALRVVALGANGLAA